MRIKILSILAAVALVSACETASEGSGKGSGSGVANAKPVETYSPPLGGGKMSERAGSQEDLVVNVGDRGPKGNVSGGQQQRLFRVSC